MHQTAPSQSLHDSRQIPWAIGLGYVLVFLLFDWVSYIRPLHGLNITPWNPQASFAIALLLWNRHWLWLVWLGLLAAELGVRGIPDDVMVVVSTTVALSLMYAAMASGLRARLSTSLLLASPRDLGWFTAIVLGGSLLCGVIYVASFTVAGLGPDGPIASAIARYWIGEAVGLIVMLPLLLVLLNPLGRLALLGALRNRAWWLAATLIGLLLWGIFGQVESDHFKFFYLLFIPVAWVSVRFGVAGATLACGLTQLGMITAVQALRNDDMTVFELQLLMAALTMTGLLLGVATDEKERLAAELRGSLRLAAAGQMAASLAHELSQPLTALKNYARAGQLLLADARGLPAPQHAQLTEVTRKIAADADRAGQVIKRLRDFFRAGTTQLQAVLPYALIHEAMQHQMRRAEALKIRLDCQLDAKLPHVLMDSLQISVVLRNLIANAIDAVSSGGTGGVVTLRASLLHHELLVEVQDNGPGIAASRLQTVFEEGTSDKPGGMGIGLSICRAIIEAHGGRLWVESGTGARFCFTLPVDSDNASESDHA